MSRLIYNSVELPYPFSTYFDQETVYDESGTDWYCTKFDIAVTCIISGDYLPLLANSLYTTGTVMTNPADVLRAARRKLMEPRRSLSFVVNGTELIPKVTQNAGTVDVRNGPQPMHCRIVQLTEASFLVDYRIVAHYWERTATATGVIPRPTERDNILYNRWTETVETDQSQYSTYTREGRYVMRSDNPSGAIVDEMRAQMVFFGIRPGFVRESAQYTVSPDGLALKYQIKDREVFKLPPTPAFEARGEYFEKSSNKGHLRWVGQHVSLRGSRATDQTQLIDRAVAICASKLTIADAQLVGRKFTNLADYTLKVGSWDNTAECTMLALAGPRGSARRAGVPLGPLGEAALLAADAAIGAGQLAPVGVPTWVAVARTPFSSATAAPPPVTLRGTAGILLKAAGYWDPSLQAPQVANAGNEFTAGLFPGAMQVGQAGVNLER